MMIKIQILLLEPGMLKWRGLDEEMAIWTIMEKKNRCKNLLIFEEKLSKLETLY